jgi:hypothetical protein
MATTQVPAPPTTSDEQQIKIVSHSTLFYWWPVWAVGFMLAILTYLDNHIMAFVPPGTEPLSKVKVVGPQGELADRDALVVPSGSQLPHDPRTNELARPYLRVAENKSYGVLYTIVLLLVIVITNVPLRGLWSVVVLVIIVMTAIIFALADWWRPILDTVGALHIHINAAGYLLISTALLIVWLVTFFFFDQQIYMVFTPRQLRVRQEIGGGEAAYDTIGMVLQKQRNDLFRHWILGLGSGDLIVNTSGANAHHFDLPNVLFVGHKVKMIEEMLREVPVVRG